MRTHSDYDDLFIVADKHVTPQLLYSLKSVSCYINPEYSNPANFDQVMDIFATQSLASSRHVFCLGLRHGIWR